MTMNYKPENIKSDPPYMENDGIRIYGEKVRDVELSDIESMIVPQEAILHVTRHLNELTSDARLKLVGKQIEDEGTTIMIDEEFINKQLESAGSKFNNKISDPEIIIAICRDMIFEAIDSNNIAWMKNSQTGEMTARFQIEMEDKHKEMLGLNSEEMLGTASVIGITSEIQGQVERELRGKGEVKDQIEINVIRNIPVPETDNLIVVIKKEDELSEPYFYTTYTGVLAPSLPRPEEQSSDELEYNRDWWDGHAFIK